jgi:hypothetical protein
MSAARQRKASADRVSAGAALMVTRVTCIEQDTCRRIACSVSHDRKNLAPKNKNREGGFAYVYSSTWCWRRQFGAKIAAKGSMALLSMS